MQGTKDTAGVIAPPPLLALATIILGLLLDWLLPAYALTVFLSGTVRTILGVAFIGAGLALVIAANIVFRTAGTHPEPWKPSTALVTDGIFAWLRNPMYVGGWFFCRSALRCCKARGAVPRGKVRGKVPSLSLSRAALRLAGVKTPKNLCNTFRPSSLCQAGGRRL
jgi:hypothetical protein